VGQLGIETAVDGPHPIVRLSGELDISGAEEAEASIANLEQTMPGDLIIDLRALEFLDSTGLRLILSADARARERDATTFIVRGPETVHRVFRMAGLEGRLTFVSDPAEAVSEP
jgi:anti-sigma B factor antagonist